MPRLTTLLMIGVAMFAMAFLTAPWFAFRALREAAQAGDRQALAELVDYPAVRASLKPQLTPAAAPAPPADPWRDPVGAIRRMIEPMRPVPPAVDRHMTPEGLYALTADASGGPALPGLDYWGPRRVRFEVDGATLTFRRRGLFTWKLTHVGLPEPAAVALTPPGRPPG
jgi:hypothetical protein